jgi:tetratricopeptide (TPR) repeat protein
MRRRRRRHRRLNKTAAFIGVLVFALLMLVAFLAVSHQRRDPAQFTALAETALAEGNYDAAVLNYRQALGATEDKADKVNLLFALARAYVHTDEWPKVMACWNHIVVEQPDNVKARLALLEATYVQADSQSRAGWQIGQVWRDVETQASELIEVVQSAGLLEQSKAQWQALDWETQDSAADITLGLYLYRVRGRAAYEQAHLGAVLDPNRVFAQAEADLQEVLRRDASQVDAYGYLAQVITERGEAQHARGDRQARAQAAQSADAFLARAVEHAPQDAQAHIFLLEAHLNRIRTQVEDIAERRRQLALMEKDYRALVDRFSNEPVVFSSLARFYWMQGFFAEPEQRFAMVNRALEAARRATALAPDRVDLWLALGELHFRQAMRTQDTQALEQAMAVGQQALQSPEAVDTSGPRAFANKANRLSLWAFLAHGSIEHVLMSGDAPDDAMLTQARQAVAQVAQILGSEDDPEVAKWRGMLALAEGHAHEAIRILYAVYEKTKASHAHGGADPVVSYALARACLDTPEQGKALEFLSASLKAGLAYLRPHVFLDYLELLGRLDMWSHVLSASNAYSVDSYEEYFGANDRSLSLRIRALLGTQRWQKAEAHLNRLPVSSQEATSLRLLLIQARVAQARSEQGPGGTTDSAAAQARMDALQSQRADLVRRQLDQDPTQLDVTALVQTLQYAIEEGHLDSVHDLIERTRGLAADHAAVGFYQALVREADPAQVSLERRRELEAQALSALADPTQRGLELGRFYQRQQKTDLALAEYMRLVDAAESPAPVTPGSPSERQRRTRISLGASLALGIAMEMGDASTMEHIIRCARQADLDACQGRLFEAQVAQSRNQFEAALEKINVCLRQRPLYSQAYLLRSQIYTALERYEEALADMTEAVTLNPMDPLMAKVHAHGLLARNQRLAERVTEVQTDEGIRALERALRLQPSDGELLGLYAQHTVDRDPAKAVAIYQALNARYGTLEHALTLGDLATHVARQEIDAARREAYYRMAGAAYEKAAAMDPQDPHLLRSYARYYRLTGQEDKAAALLVQGQDDALLWQHFLQQGDFDRARQVLEQAYQEDPRNEQVIRGLLAVAQQQDRTQDVEHYSQVLVDVADTLNNRIEQITALLRLGQVQQAEARLQAAGKRFPDEPRVILLEGWVSLRLGRLDHALDRIEESLQADRDSAVAWYLRGQVHLLQGDAKTAIEDLRRSKVLQDSPTTRLTLAKALLQAGRRDEAIVELKQSVTEKQAPRQARQLLEQLYLEAGRVGELESFYTQMQRLFPGDVYWLNRAGAFQLQQGQAEQAARLYGQSCTRKRNEGTEASAEAWRSDRDFVDACHGYFQALLAMGSADRIASEAQAYVGTPFEAMTRLYLAQARMKQGQRAEAVNEIRSVLTLDVPSPELGSLVTRMVQIVGRQEVQRLCDAMVKAEPYAQAGTLGQFYLLAGAGQYDSALAALDRCLATLTPQEDRFWQLHLERVKLLTAAYEKTTQAHYRDQAIVGYESLLDKWPTNSNILNNLAYLLAGNQNRLPEALAYAQKAWAAAPNNPMILDTYGYVLLKDGQYQRALELLSAARQQYEQGQSRVPPQVFEHLGQAWEALGEKEKARQAFEQALTSVPRALTTRAETRIRSAIGRLSP